MISSRTKGRFFGPINKLTGTKLHTKVANNFSFAPGDKHSYYAPVYDHRFETRHTKIEKIAKSINLE